ncbi:DNA polymerase, partial [Vibrio fluvialis]
PNPFGSSTGREAPKGASFNYLSKTIRNHLLHPKKGDQIFVLDYSSQEPASLAALTGDHELWAAYLKGDLYLELQSRSAAFAELDRASFKRLCIAHLYGITPSGIRKKYRVSPTVAAIWDRELRVIFPRENAYLDQKVQEARKQGYAEVFGFRR